MVSACSGSAFIKIFAFSLFRPSRTYPIAMKRIGRRLSVHTSSLDQHHEIQKHSVLPTLSNCKEKIKKHFEAVEVTPLKEEDLRTTATDTSKSVDKNRIIELNTGVNSSEIQHDLRTTPEIRSSHSVRKILTVVSKLKFFERLNCKETLQQFAAKGIPAIA